MHVLMISIGIKEGEEREAPIRWILGPNSRLKPFKAVFVEDNEWNVKKGFCYGDMFLFILPGNVIKDMEENNGFNPEKTKMVKAIIRNLLPSNIFNMKEFRFQWMIAELDKLKSAAEMPSPNLIEIEDLTGSSGGGNI